MTATHVTATHRAFRGMAARSIPHTPQCGGCDRSGSTHAVHVRLSPPRRSPPSRYLVITQALAAIAERFLPEGYFSEDLRGVYMDQHLAFAVFLPHLEP